MDSSVFAISSDKLRFGSIKKQNLWRYSPLLDLIEGIIYFIESYKRNGKDSTSLLGFDSYSLEHLMPKKWRNNWDTCATEELSRQRDSLLLTLGNLAIIPQSLNASIRDSSWEAKKVG